MSMREVCPHANHGRPSVSPRPCSIFRRGLKYSFSSPSLAAITKPSGLRCPLECIAREGSPTQVRRAVARRAPRPRRSTPHGQKGDPIERRPARSLASSQPLPKSAQGEALISFAPLARTPKYCRSAHHRCSTFALGGQRTSIDPIRKRHHLPWSVEACHKHAAHPLA